MARVVPAAFTRAKQLTLFGLALLMAGSLAACDLISLEEVEPAQSISVEGVVNSREGFEGLVTSLYDRLQNTALYGQQFILYPEALADNVELVPGNSSNRYPAVVQNISGVHLNNWIDLYSSINEANLVVANVDDLEIDAQNAEAIRQRLKGEALFMRGLAYFDLARTKGYEPGQEVDGWNNSAVIRLEPTLSIADADERARSSNEQTYQQVESDLTEAVSLLEGNPNVGSAPRRATAAAAYGLLSRAYLYHGSWASAEQAATSAIAQAEGLGITVVNASQSSLIDAWLQPSYAGSIFELGMTTGQDGASTNSNGALQALTTPGAFSYEVLPSSDLLGIHAESDARRSLLAADADGNIYMQKYTGTISPFADRIPIIRLAEMYLNRAEARAQQGDLEGGMEDLNYLKVRRGLDAVSGLSQSALIDEVMAERRRELAFEGHRFFDLKRHGMDVPKPQFGQVLPYTDYKILAQLPTAEVRSNTELVQNPGY